MAELYCDICGNGPVRAQILVEGAKMLACARCMRSGKILHLFDEREEAPSVSGTYVTTEAGEEIVDDCARIIRNARDRVKLPLAVVAERIKEKESYLHAIENGRLAPTVEVARKLERELGIKLVEKSQSTIVPSDAAKPGGFSAPTLGDMIQPKKKKK